MQGDWVAWRESRYPDGTLDGVPPFFTIRLYNRESGRRWDLFDRAVGMRSMTYLVEQPRLAGEYVYFLLYEEDRPARNTIFRCHLPTLFPEEYP